MEIAVKPNIFGSADAIICQKNYSQSFLLSLFRMDMILLIVKVTPFKYWICSNKFKCIPNINMKIHIILIFLYYRMSSIYYKILNLMAVRVNLSISTVTNLA